jgi:hypothetical protein
VALAQQVSRDAPRETSRNPVPPTALPVRSRTAAGA